MSGTFEIQRAYQSVPELAFEGEGDRSHANGFVPDGDATVSPIPADLCRDRIENFPDLSEIEVVRHYTRLSRLNFSIDEGFYPLGSCTMKYNPKVNDVVASMEGFAMIHPLAPEHFAQGALEVMFRLQQALVSITGLHSASLHPAAGAHGELVGVKMIRAYHRARGDDRRRVILIPDTAHGTNPASAALSGFSVKALASSEKGTVDPKIVAKEMNETVAGIMMTVPNTLGVFENDVLEIAGIVHKQGGLVYCDGANLNALVGKVDVGAMGVDVMHINLHKTFSTPHGGGGPGAGPVVVSEKLKDFLPVPIVRRNGDVYTLDSSLPKSVGRFRAFHGNFGMLVRALCYIYAFGQEHIAEISEGSVLKANYLKARLKDHFHLPYDVPTLHEVVFTDKFQQKVNHVTTLDIAKRLMDFGFHPPTIYFPLVVKGALMIEPTETESLAELDRFVAAMIQISEEATSDPEKVRSAPHNVGIRRLDETAAARNLVLTWNKTATSS